MTKVFWQFWRKREIDRSVNSADSAAVLPESNTALGKFPTGRRRGRKRRIWIALGMLLLGLFWLDGPGFRWIAPRVATHFPGAAGLHGGFGVEGRLSRGFALSKLRFAPDLGRVSLDIDRLTFAYPFSGWVRGQGMALTLDGVHVEYRLGAKREKLGPLDLKKWVGNLQRVRSGIIPVDLDFRNVTVSASDEGRPVLSLAPSRLFHRSGSEDFLMELGEVTDSENREWPAQRSTLSWRMDRLELPRLDPLPGVVLREAVLHLPLGGEPSVDADACLDDAVFRITSAPGLSTFRVDLRSGKLAIAEAAKRFGYEIAAANLRSFSLELAGVIPDPTAATGRLHLGFEDALWDEWRMPSLTLDTVLTADECSLTGRAELVDGAVSLNAVAPISRESAGLLLGRVKGDFGIDGLPQVLRELAKHTSRIDAAAKIPPSTVAGRFDISFDKNEPTAASVELVLKPQDGALATDIALKSRWQKDQPLSADLVLDGLSATATYQPKSASYQAEVEFNECKSRRLELWLAVAKLRPVGTVNLSGKWSGSGEPSAGKHRGNLSLAQATWSRPAAAPLKASGSVKYDWPAHVETQGLRLEMNGQTVLLDATVADHSLEIGDFLWSDGVQEIASGRARLPLPDDFLNWRTAQVADASPVRVEVHSRALSLGLLKPWFPALDPIDPRAKGRIDLRVSGTCSAPIVDAKLEVKDLRTTTQPSLPPADLKVTLVGRDGRLVIDAVATAPDFPAAAATFAMPFHPYDWAMNPQHLKNEFIGGRMDLPRLDLSRFAALLPAAEKISGTITGNLQLAGTVAKPTANGSIELSNAGLRLKNHSLPAVENVAAAVDLSLDRLVLKSLSGSVAGGSLKGGGSISVAGGKLGELDLRLRGDHLLLRRDDLLILRANADLRLQGPWAQAKLTGTVAAVDSIFYRDIELLPIGMPFTTPQAAALPKVDVPEIPARILGEPYRDWGVDLTLRTEMPILIRGNFAAGQIDGRVRIGGTWGNPQPDGVVTLKDFRAALPFSSLSVRKGTATFTPATGFDPIMELRGIAEPRPYQVTVYAYGRASAPQLVLTSNPPLPDNEIMTLLATGTTTAGLENSQAASSRALQLLVEEMRRGRFRFGKQLRPLFALLDRVDFTVAEADPYSNESFSTATLSLTDRWFLSAGMGATGDSRMLAIWRLTFR